MTIKSIVTGHRPRGCAERAFLSMPAKYDPRCVVVIGEIRKTGHSRQHGCFETRRVGARGAGLDK